LSKTGGGVAGRHNILPAEVKLEIEFDEEVYDEE